VTAEHDHLAHQLVTVMTQALGESVGVCAVERLKGGYSRRMWAFDSTGPHGTARWILCTDADDGVVGADSLSRPREARLLEYVHRAGLPVPAIAASGEGPESFGAAWFVMQRLPGTAAVGPLLHDPEISAMRATLGTRKPTSSPVSTRSPFRTTCSRRSRHRVGLPASRPGAGPGR
jgi:aminoglycoside phosphotransferase (APT) family kinase protein